MTAAPKLECEWKQIYAGTGGDGMAILQGCVETAKKLDGDGWRLK